jgi:hypothetical protein
LPMSGAARSRAAAVAAPEDKAAGLLRDAGAVHSGGWQTAVQVGPGVLDSTTRRHPPKSEFRGPKPERRPNTECRSQARAVRVSGFGLLSALGFRASGLGLCAHGLVVLSSTPDGSRPVRSSLIRSPGRARLARKPNGVWLMAGSDQRLARPQAQKHRSTVDPVAGRWFRDPAAHACGVQSAIFRHHCSHA